MPPISASISILSFPGSTALPKSFRLSAPSGCRTTSSARGTNQRRVSVRSTSSSTRYGPSTCTRRGSDGSSSQPIPIVRTGLRTIRESRSCPAKSSSPIQVCCPPIILKLSSASCTIFRVWRSISSTPTTTCSSVAPSAPICSSPPAGSACSSRPTPESVWDTTTTTAAGSRMRLASTAVCYRTASV